MKTTRKLLALVLALAMIMAMAITVSAATIEITNKQDDLTQEVYKMCTYETDAYGNKWFRANGDAWKSFLDTVYNIDPVTGYLLNYKNSSETDASFATKLTDWVKSNYASIAGTKVDDLTNVGTGYYVLVTKKGDTIKDRIGAAPLTDPDGKLSIKQKNTSDGLPTIQKTLSGLGNDYKVGDVADFNITVETAENKSSYTIHDTMTGLELEGAINVTVPAGATYEIKTSGTCGCTFEVVVSYGTGTSNAYEKIIITYKAKVTEEGVEKITNKAEVDDKDATVEKSTRTVTLTKTDGSDNQLEGAKFRLYTKIDGVETEVPVVKVGDYYRLATAGETGEDIIAGKVEIKGLAVGTAYYLKETQAPAGYVKYAGDISLSTGDVKVENTKAQTLPETGGMGTTLFYTVGGIMVLAAVVLLITKKRMAVK